MVFVFLLSCNYCFAQSIKYPLLEYTNADQVVITEIITDHNLRRTKVNFELFAAEDQSLSIPKGMYINNAEDQKHRYELIQVKNNQFIPGEWYPLEGGKTYRYTLIFQGISPNTSIINIYEPKIPNVEPWVWKKVHVKKMSIPSVMELSKKEPEKKETEKKAIIGY